jgi:hypothetical protein
MKNSLFSWIVLLFIMAANPIIAQTSLISDNFGTAAQNPISRTGYTANAAGGSNWELRTSIGSTGYSWSSPSVSASGGANVFTNLGTNNNTKQLTYDNSLSTVGYTTIVVRFGGIKVLTVPNINVFYSANGGAYTSAGTVALTTSWAAYSVALPVGAEGVANLAIRFEVVANSGSGNNIRLDDFQVIGTAASCTAPSQASAVVLTSNTVDGFNAGWTAGTGNGTMLVVRPTANSNTLPTSGTSYTANTAWASAGQIDVNNRVVFRAAGTSLSGLTGLTAETQYTATAYEYNSAGDCYNLTSPPSNTIHTLSLEPASHAASFSCIASSYNQIDLTFSAASTITNADGYIILQKTGSAPTGLPSDATAYTVGNTIGDATVAAIVTNTATTTAAITSLVGSTNYFYTIIPFNWNGSIAATYNYRTSVTIPGSNCTTPATPSLISDIINDGTFVYTQNIDYTLYQAATITNTSHSIGVYKFTIRDGGAASPDGDALPTILAGITFSSIAGIANIRSAALFDGNSMINNAPTINVGGGTIAFSGLSYTCTDNATRNLTLRVTFLTSAITDNQQMSFAITNANAIAASSLTSSQFSSFSTITSSTTLDNNRIEVLASQLGYVQQPSNSSISASMTPAVTIEAKDANNNRDLDFTAQLDITSTGTLSATPITITAVSGIATFSTIVHTASGTGFTLNAERNGTLDWDITSSSFDIANIPANSFRTTTGGTWTSGGGTATWEQLVSGTWGTSSAPSFGTSNNIYFRHAISITGSASASNVVVENGGTLTNSASCTYGGTLCRVETGGTLQINASVTIAGAFEVQDNATVNVNFAFGTPATSIWAGTENFHPLSNFVIKNWDFATPDHLIPDNTSISTSTYGGYTACFGNIILDAGVNSTSNWVMFASGVNINAAHGDLIFRTTQNTSDVVRMITVGTVTTGIGGNFIVESTFTTSTVNIKTSGTLTFNIRGNLLLQAATTRVLAGSVGVTTLNINGNITLSNSAILDFNSTVSAVPVATINLMGDLIVGSSAVLQNSNTSNLGTLNFTGTGDGLSAATTQSIDIASSSTNENKNILFTVNSGAYVQLANRNLELGSNASVIVASGGVFDFGFLSSTALNVVEVPAAASATVFNLNSGGKIKITHANGIDAGTAAEGNVRTDTRTFSTTGIYHYIGITPSQRVGDGLPAASAGKYVIIELDALATQLAFEGYNGSSYVTTGNIGISASGNGLKIIQGTVIGTNTADFTGGGNVEMTGGEYQISVDNGTATPVPQMTGTYTLSAGKVHLNGANVSQTLRGAPTYYNLKISGTNTLGVNAKTISSSTTVNNNVEITANTIFDLMGTALNGNAGLTMTGGLLRISKLTNNQPELTATASGQSYNLTGGTIELYGTTSSTSQTLRSQDGNNNNITFFNLDLNATAANTNAENIVIGNSITATGTVNHNSPTVLKLSALVVINGGSYIMASGATLKYGSANGIMTSGASGNIQTSTRTFPSSGGSFGFIGSGNMNTGNALPANMTNLYVAKGAAINLVTFNNGSNTTATDNLIMTQGNLSIPSIYYLELGNSTSNKGSITYSAGLIDGSLRRWFNGTNSGISSSLFPLGNSAINDRQVSVSYTTAPTTGGYLTGKYVSSSMGTNGLPIAPGSSGGFGNTVDISSTDGYWQMDNQAATLTDGNYTLTGNTPAPTGAIAVADVTLLKRVGAGNWLSPGAHVAASGTLSLTTVSRTGITGWSNFGAGGFGNIVLPIRFISFFGNTVNHLNILEWQVEDNFNIIGYEIQHSSNGTSFEKCGYLGFDKANFLTNKFTDSLPFLGSNYYRIIILYNDGHKNYSPIIYLYNTVLVGIVDFYPNPVINTISLSLVANIDHNFSIGLYNNSGIKVRDYNINLLKGSNKVNLDCKEIAAGVYYIKNQPNSNLKFETIKFIKQ